jgi:GntR family transcriptional regulator
MQIDLDPAAPAPLFRQLADGIRRLIGLGALRAGDRLPTVRDLATQARVNRNTAARAIQLLEAEGLVRTRVGSGTYIAEDAADRVTDAGTRRLSEAIDQLIETAEAASVPLRELPSRVSRRLEQLRRQAATPPLPPEEDDR